ncbi:MAG TPA: hypothetical protein VE869_16010 [Gemmatimonas sp.]|nr:hypothetical protein [Gemmatimonas sp.]
MRVGVLHLLVMMPMDGDYLDYAHALAWKDFPPSACWGQSLVSNIDFGDWECAALPTVPDAPGLWLLRWAWETCKDEDEFDSARYASTCEWTRPTTDDLIAIGALPSATPDDGGRP